MTEPKIVAEYEVVREHDEDGVRVIDELRFRGVSTEQAAMTPQTPAGRALLDLFIADSEVPGQLDWKRMGDSIAAIEQQAKQQERDRIRPLLVEVAKAELAGQVPEGTVRAILAEPSE